MEIERVLERFERKPENLLLILHALQEAHPKRYLTDEALARAAAYLNLTAAQVAGTAGYYSMLSLAPRGRHLARVCVSPVCRMKGSREILAALAKRLGVTVGGTTADGRVTLESTQCVGGCAQAPCMTVDNEYHIELTEEKAAAVLAALASLPPAADAGEGAA